MAGESEDVSLHGDDDVGAQRPEGAGADTGTRRSFVGLPTQSEEIQELAVLSKDAAEILWEMVAMGSTGPEVVELRERAHMLRAQLRGLINDYTISADSNENILAKALESFEMLSQCLDSEQQQPAKSNEQAKPQTQQSSEDITNPATDTQEPNPVSSRNEKAETDAPLISLD